MTPEQERHYANLLGARIPRRYDPAGLYAALVLAILALAFVVWAGAQLWPR